MDRLRRVAWGLSLAYPPAMALSYLNLPFPANFIVGAYSSVMPFIAFYLLTSYSELRARDTGLLLATAYATSYTFEFLGVHYGIPFGKYYYTQSGLGPQLLGVPLFIPLLWASLGFYSLCALGSYPLAALGMVSMDLAFDPMLSGRARLWVWQSPGQYYGVPLLNFVGWFIVSITFYYLYVALGGRRPRPSAASTTFYLSYVAAWAFMDALAGLAVAGLVGLSAAVALVIIKALLTQRPGAAKG